MNRAKTGLAFATPAFLYFIAFWFLPVALTVYYSLTDWNLAKRANFVGLHNFVRLFSDPRFLQSLKITVLMSAGIMLLSTLISFGIAQVLNDRSLIGSNMFRTLFFIPVITDWIATGLVWQFIFLPYDGVLASFFYSIGLIDLMDLRWTGNRVLAPFAIMIFVLWKTCGLYIVMFSAGLRSIPQMYTEAALMDGATPLQLLRHITLPLLRPVTLFVVVISFVSAVTIFEPVYMLTHGGPVDATRTLALLMYDTFFVYQKAGYASAQAIITLILLLGFAFISARRFQHGFYED